MRRLALAFLVVAAVGTAHAEAITVREVIELSKTGLSDEVLLALIEIEPQVFPVDPETLKALKQGGVSDRVITALVRHRRTTPVEPRDPAPDPAAPPEPQPAPQPQVVVIDHRDEHVREVPVAVPLYVPVLVHAPRHRDGQVVTPVQVFAPSIGLVHSRLGLSPPPPTPTSDPPHWHRYAPLPRRSDPPYWKKSPYLK
jgi:hypothetical protein